MKLESKAVLDEIDFILALIENDERQSRQVDLSDLTAERHSEIATLIAQAIERFSPPGSTYRSRMQQTLQEFGSDGIRLVRLHLTGVLAALRKAYERGFLQSVQELVHSDVFSDFLSMAQYLLSEGYKDPAAVLVGGVLEEHLRKLCHKNSISVDDPVSGRPRKADTLNADLVKAGVYDKLEQKNVVAWLDLRNKAAHGEYDQYDEKHVELMLQGVTDFLSRHRA